MLMYKYVIPSWERPSRVLLSVLCRMLAECATRVKVAYTELLQAVFSFDCT